MSVDSDTDAAVELDDAHPDGDRALAVAHDALGRPARVVIIRALSQFGAAKTTDIAAALMADLDMSEEAARIGVHHKHLPRLEDLGIVDYARDEEVVALTEWGDAVALAHQAFEGVVEAESSAEDGHD